MAYGTLMSWDSLHQSNETILDLGEAAVFATLQQQLRAHNAMLSQVLSDFVEVRTDSIRGEFQQDVFGGDDVIYLDPIAELGRADAEKTTAGDTVGFPIEGYAKSVQWTRLAFEMMTGAELARQFDAIAKGNAIQVRNSILNTIFSPTNRTVIDRLTDKKTLSVKALTNADSGFIPPGPYGTAFDSSTHTHYLATASLVAANVDSLIETVVEHYNFGRSRIYINRAMAATISNTTNFPKFVPYLAAPINPPDNTTTVNRNLNTMNLENRAIGLYDGVSEIWVKPWMPNNYLFHHLAGPAKPVRMRQRRGGMYLATEDETYPLRTRMLAHEYGCGIIERTNGAVLYTGGGAYVAPTF
jgi:hypothetical protein